MAYGRMLEGHVRLGRRHFAQPGVEQMHGRQQVELRFLEVLCTGERGQVVVQRIFQLGDLAGRFDHLQQHVRLGLQRLRAFDQLAARGPNACDSVWPPSASAAASRAAWSSTCSASALPSAASIRRSTNSSAVCDHGLGRLLDHGQVRIVVAGLDFEAVR